MKTLPENITRNLRLPMVCAPMFLVSGLELVRAACRSGIIGSFPGPNCRTIEDLEPWMETLSREATGDVAPWAYNMITHSTYPRFDAELELVAKYRPPVVITALGGPQRVIETVKSYGGVVFSDVNTVAFAEKAAKAGADGLVLVCSGAGGHTGQMANVAFIEAVRSFFDGPIAVGGGISTGAGLAGVIGMGADLGYVGTAFIAAEESIAFDAYKQMVVEASAADLVVSDAITGVPASWLRPSLEAAGIDVSAKREAGKVAFADPSGGYKAWKHVWAAGQGVGAVRGIEPVEAIVARMEGEFRAARTTSEARMGRQVERALS